MVGGARKAVALFFLSFAVAASAIGWLVVTVDNGQDLVRVRNALILRQSDEGAYSWTPKSIPPDFLWERQSASAPIQTLTARVLQDFDDAPGSFRKALELARHLVQAGNRSGQPIQKDFGSSYTAIVEQGDGFCSDYTQVFNGLALAAGIPVREWGMSFDAFGGDGHAFSEIFDESLGKWVFIDTYYSFYVTNPEGAPVSVLELQAALLNAQSSELRVVPIVESEFLFPSAEYALEYYRAGIGSLFMMWGNNVFSYDDNAIVGLAARISRSVEQAAAILLGLHPALVVIPNEENRSDLQSLIRLRRLLIIIVVAAIVFVFSIAYLMIRGRRSNATT